MVKSKYAVFSAVILATVITAVSTGTDNRETCTEDNRSSGKVVMVIADYLSIEDINSMEFLNKLAGESFLALMNNRQQGKAGSGKSKLTIGSGKRLEFGEGKISDGNGFYEGRLFYKDIYRIKHRNSRSEYRKYIGYIGNVVNENNGYTCYLGNADTDKYNRDSMLIAVDGEGFVDMGETEAVIVEENSYPYGKRTDYKKLAELYKQYLPASSFVVIETGDMERLEKVSNSISHESYMAYRHDVLSSIDGFVKEIFDTGGFGTLIFISTYPSRKEAEGNNRLTPVVVYQSKGGGFLYSTSTRREGIVLNTDIADYVLEKLGYANYSAVSEVNRNDPVCLLQRMNRRIVRTSALRAPVLTSYAGMVMAGLVVIFIAAVFPGIRLVNNFARLCFPVAYAELAVPLTFLCIPVAYTGDSPAVYMAITVSVSLLLALAVHFVIKDRIKAIFVICMLIFTGLSVDVLTGGNLIKQSVLGYDPVIGARFYGIGNEYAGVFIGCSHMILGCIQEIKGDRLGKALTILLFTACNIILGLTFTGANFGGALAAAAGYLLAYFIIYGIKLNGGSVVKGTIIMIAAAALLIVTDSLGIGSPSHMGVLVKDVEINGMEVVISTVKRKLSMNLRLIRYTVWTKVLLSIIAIISLMLYRPVKLLVKLFERCKYLKYSWIGIAASAITGFAVNDSGIVLAATAMIYTAFTMLVMCIGERNEY